MHSQGENVCLEKQRPALPLSGFGVTLFKFTQLPYVNSATVVHQCDTERGSTDTELKVTSSQG